MSTAEHGAIEDVSGMAEEEHVDYAVQEAVAEVCEPQTAISTVLGLGPSAIIGSSPAPSNSNGSQTAV